MRRTLNYTERKRIHKKRVTIELVEDESIKNKISVLIDLEGLDLPENANVYLEPYFRTELFREFLGKAKDVDKKNTKIVDLSQSAYRENLKFRLIVVDKTSDNGLILASAEKISLITKEDKGTVKRCILSVDFEDIGKQIWNVEFNDDQPVLMVNENIPNIRNIVKSDPRFFLYVYPAVIRKIFTHMIFIEGVPDKEDSESWHKDWFDFAKRYINDTETPECLDPHKTQAFDKEEVISWIDKIVGEFCVSSKDKWNNFINMEEKNQ